jgi:hypothetical protein
MSLHDERFHDFARADTELCGGALKRVGSGMRDDLDRETVGRSVRLHTFATGERGHRVWRSHGWAAFLATIEG